MVAKRELIMMLVFSLIIFFTTFSISLADSIELIASKTNPCINENVLLVAIAKFKDINNIRVESIKIFENNKVIKECKNIGSEAFICYAFVSSGEKTTKTYYAEIVYYRIVDPTLRSNEVKIVWRDCECEECKRYLVEIDKKLVDIISLLKLLLEISNKEISLLEKNLDFLKEIRNLVIEILKTVKFNTQQLNEIIKILNDLSLKLSENTEMIKEILAIVKEISKNQQLTNELLDRIIKMLGNLQERSTYNTELLKEMMELLEIINKKIDRMDISLYKQLTEIKNSINSLLILIKDSYQRPYVIDVSGYFEREKYCLTFERVENRIVEENRVVILLRNCGKEPLYNITVLLKFKEEIFVRVISSIYPNEVKALTFYIGGLIGERNLVSVYAFNNLVSISYDFYLERYGYLSMLRIEIKDTEIVKGEWKEFYIILKNNDIKPLTNLEVKLDAPQGIMYSLETNRITLTPMQTKSIKVRMFVNEEFDKDKFNIKVSVGELEKIFEFKVIEKLKKNEEIKPLISIQLTNYVAAFLIFLIIVIAIILLIVLRYEKIVKIRKIPEI